MPDNTGQGRFADFRSADIRHNTDDCKKPVTDFDSNQTAKTLDWTADGVVLRPANGARIGMCPSRSAELYRWRDEFERLRSCGKARMPGTPAASVTNATPSGHASPVPEEQTERQRVEEQARPQRRAVSTAVPLHGRSVLLEHALALQAAGTAVSGTYFPADMVKRILLRFRPVCYICSMCTPADSDRVCYVCGLSWWPKFEQTLDDVHEAEALLSLTAGALS